MTALSKVVFFLLLLYGWSCKFVAKDYQPKFVGLGDMGYIVRKSSATIKTFSSSTKSNVGILKNIDVL